MKKAVDYLEKLTTLMERIPDFMIPAFLIQVIGFGAVNIVIYAKLKEERPLTLAEKQQMLLYEAVSEFSTAVLGGWIIKNTTSLTGEAIGCAVIGVAPAIEEIISLFASGMPGEKLNEAADAVFATGKLMSSLLSPKRIILDQSTDMVTLLTKYAVGKVMY